MQTETIKQHFIDLAKGTAAAMITAAAFAGLQYLGNHIPDLLQLFAPGGAAIAVIKSSRSKFFNPMENVPVEIIVHHTAVGGDGDQFDGVNEYHKSRDFPLSSLGFYVGYQYLIEKTGAIRQAREENEEGAHTIGENTRSIGICLSGEFDTESPTEAQIDSLGILLSAACKTYGIPTEMIFPHRHFAQKTCYGSRLPDDWAQNVRKYYEQKLIIAEATTLCDTFKTQVNI